jgi:hypothetical protein
LSEIIQNFDSNPISGSNNCYAACDDACARLASDVDKKFKFVIIFDDLEQVNSS